MSTFRTEAEMGRTYRDEHTGFEGVCTSLHFYLTGCNRASLEAPAEKKTGKIGDEVTFDTIRLIDVKTGNKVDQGGPVGPVALATPASDDFVSRRTGGPRTVTQR